MVNPTYGDVSTGSTGYAEAIQITFDPGIVSFDTLLEIFWATHDPTTLNKQGNDVGTQYRSVIFYHDKQQMQSAKKSKEDEEYGLDKKIVTEIAPFERFYSAEEYHQSYYDRNTSYPYCSFIIAPKVKKLLEKFADKVKDEHKAS